MKMACSLLMDRYLWPCNKPNRLLVGGHQLRPKGRINMKKYHNTAESVFLAHPSRRSARRSTLCRRLCIEHHVRAERIRGGCALSVAIALFWIIFTCTTDLHIYDQSISST